jgi:hypothetical protein
MKGERREYFVYAGLEKHKAYPVTKFSLRPSRMMLFADYWESHEVLDNISTELFAHQPK